MKVTRVIVVVAILTVLYFIYLIQAPFIKIYDGPLIVRPIYDTSLYVLYPNINYWKRLTPKGLDVLSPVAWSPNGDTIAFFYSVAGIKWDSGIALFNLQNTQFEKISINKDEFQHIDRLKGMTWTHDGKSLLFIYYDDNNFINFRKLDIETQKMDAVKIPEEIKAWTYINSFVVSAQGAIIMERNGFIYIVPQNTFEVKLLTKGRDVNLSPDGNEILFFCHMDQWKLCSVNLLEAKYKVKPITGALRGYPSDPNLSPNEDYLVYIQSGGESDPSYIVVLDVSQGKTYQIYPSNLIRKRMWFDDIAWQ